MLGTGMPWGIILSFFAIGIMAGLISARIARHKADNQ